MTHETPVYRVSVLGGFSVTTDSAAPDSRRSRRPEFIDIDRDVIDPVISGLVGTLSLDLPFRASWALSGWDDVTPDRILERVPVLASLLQARRTVGDPQQMRGHLRDAGIELQGLDPAPSPGSAASPSAAGDAAAGGTDAGLLDSLLDGSSPGRARGGAPSREADPLDRAVQAIVAESADGRDLQREDAWRDTLDEALSNRLRAVLAHPDFRQLEASCRSLRDLVRAGDDHRVALAVADFPQHRLRSEIGSAGGGDTLSALFAGDTAAGGDRSADLIVTDYGFDAGEDSRRELVALLEIAARLSTPILAAAIGSARYVEHAEESDLEAWSELRRHPGARWLALCAPSLLLRLPYGPDTDPIESFPFDESVRADAAEGHLFGSGAFGLARAAVLAASSAGGIGAIERFCELGGLPIHVSRAAGETVAIGPVDEIVTEARREAWSLMGVNAITGVVGSDTVRILSLRSLSGDALF